MIAFVIASAIVQTMMTFATIAQGSSSQILEPRQVVVHTLDEWRTLWNDHSPQAAPDVDFSESIVVGIFLGTRPTAGFQVEITTVKPEDNRAVVGYVEHSPEPGALALQVLTSPFHVVSLPRDVGAIEFRRIEQSL